MDCQTRDICYPWLTDGELDAMDGPVFGRAFLVFGGGSKKDLKWSPSDCDVCEDPSMLFHWNNYNYRCCPACWAVIKKQLWEKLEDEINERPANVVWAFLIEPARH